VARGVADDELRLDDPLFGLRASAGEPFEQELGRLSGHVGDVVGDHCHRAAQRGGELNRMMSSSMATLPLQRVAPPNRPASTY